MMGMELTVVDLINCTKEFCAKESGVFREELFGVTDGKAVGTFVESLFKSYFKQYGCGNPKKSTGNRIFDNFQCVAMEITIWQNRSFK